MTSIEQRPAGQGEMETKSVEVNALPACVLALRQTIDLSRVFPCLSPSAWWDRFQPRVCL